MLVLANECRNHATEWGRAARAHSIEGFSMAAVGAAWLDVIEDLVPSSR